MIDLFLYTSYRTRSAELTRAARNAGPPRVAGRGALRLIIDALARLRAALPSGSRSARLRLTRTSS
jgi:hypothetical protein